jgi:DnaJ-class molecular chaperone
MERRKKERGKQRFMDDYDFVNQDFFNMWKQRTQPKGEAGAEEDQTSESDPMGWNGKKIEVAISINLEDVIYAEKDSTYTIKYDQNIICTTCNGSREAADSAPMECYSCKGKGIKKDSLFK